MGDEPKALKSFDLLLRRRISKITLPSGVHDEETHNANLHYYSKLSMITIQRLSFVETRCSIYAMPQFNQE